MVKINNTILQVNVLYILYMVVMNTCVHMLIDTMCCSLHLYKKGMAPPIEDLLGKATFTGTLSIYTALCVNGTHMHLKYVGTTRNVFAISIYTSPFIS